jgi:hypothetical protein
MSDLAKKIKESVLDKDLIEDLMNPLNIGNSQVQPKLHWEFNCAVVKEVVKVNRFTKNHVDVDNDLNAFLNHFHYAPKSTYEIDDSTDILQMALEFSEDIKNSEIDLIIYHSNLPPNRIMEGRFLEYVLKHYPAKEIIIIPFRMALLFDNQTVEITKRMWNYELNYFWSN